MTAASHAHCQSFSSLLSAVQTHEGSDANEEPLGFDPLKGDWRVSLPCLADDLTWVQDALKKHSTRITARDLNAAVSGADEAATTKSQTLLFDPKGFLGS